MAEAERELLLVEEQFASGDPRFRAELLRLDALLASGK
jgi:ABC-type thiamine transport system ATPase subunit